MTETERPSVERVLEWAHNVRDSVFLLDFWVSVYQKSWNRKMFQGLIEVAEQSADKDQRIEELERENKRLAIYTPREENRLMVQNARLRDQLAEWEFVRSYYEKRSGSE